MIYNDRTKYIIQSSFFLVFRFYLFGFGFVSHPCEVKKITYWCIKSQLYTILKITSYDNYIVLYKCLSISFCHLDDTVHFGTISTLMWYDSVSVNFFYPYSWNYLLWQLFLTLQIAGWAIFFDSIKESRDTRVSVWIEHLNSHLLTLT